MPVARDGALPWAHQRLPRDPVRAGPSGHGGPTPERRTVRARWVPRAAPSPPRTSGPRKARPSELLGFERVLFWLRLDRGRRRGQPGPGLPDLLDAADPRILRGRAHDARPRSPRRLTLRPGPAARPSCAARRCCSWSPTCVATYVVGTAFAPDPAGSAFYFYPLMSLEATLVAGTGAGLDRHRREPRRVRGPGRPPRRVSATPSGPQGARRRDQPHRDDRRLHVRVRAAGEARPPGPARPARPHGRARAPARRGRHASRCSTASSTTPSAAACGRSRCATTTASVQEPPLALHGVAVSWSPATSEREPRRARARSPRRSRPAPALTYQTDAWSSDHGLAGAARVGACRDPGADLPRGSTGSASCRCCGRGRGRRGRTSCACSTGSRTRWASRSGRGSSGRVREQAATDSLTRLLNRRAINDELAALRRARRPQPAGRCAILFCDLDGFKAVNDQLGHEAGDRVLRDVAAAVRGALRAGDAAGRYGGDELLIVAADADADDAVGPGPAGRCGGPGRAPAGDGVDMTIGIARYPADGPTECRPDGGGRPGDVPRQAARPRATSWSPASPSRADVRRRLTRGGGRAPPGGGGAARASGDARAASNVGQAVTSSSPGAARSSRPSRRRSPRPRGAASARPRAGCRRAGRRPTPPMPSTPRLDAPVVGHDQVAAAEQGVACAASRRPGRACAPRRSSVPPPNQVVTAPPRNDDAVLLNVERAEGGDEVDLVRVGLRRGRLAALRPSRRRAAPSMNTNQPKQEQREDAEQATEHGGHPDDAGGPGGRREASSIVPAGRARPLPRGPPATGRFATRRAGRYGCASNSCSMGAPGRRPGPPADRLIPTHHIALTGARPAGQGPVRSVSPCHSPVSGCRPSSSAPSPTRGTRPRPRSRARPSPSSSRAATSSPGPRRAPARRRPSCCRSSTASTRPGATPAPAATRSASSSSSRRASSPSRSRSPSGPTAPTGRSAPRPSTAASAYGPQVSKLRAGPEIVVATPGRLLDHLGQGTINLSSVEVLVLDEADRMLDMGFIRDIRKILAVLPPRRQNLLFSRDVLGRHHAAGRRPPRPTRRTSRSRPATPPPSSSTSW